MDKSRMLVQELCGDIEQDEYLQTLYAKLLKRYSRFLLNRTTILSDTKLSEKEINDLLRYANILSLSSGLKESGDHKVWAQQIVALLSLIFPEDESIRNAKEMVLLNCTNYYGLKKAPDQVKNEDFFNRFYQETKYDSLKMPSSEKHFYESQKQIYDNMENTAISYSAPTSMGKSFLMRQFMIDKIKNGFKGNFALVVPTKALINELVGKIVGDIEPYVLSMDYRVVKTPDDMVLMGQHNFVFVMTQERMFHLLVTKPELAIDYIFIDEAHKISQHDSRSVFYLKILSMLSSRKNKPHVIFASPNIPNPEEYLKLADPAGKYYRTTYSPVSQIKYIINLQTGKHYVYNDYARIPIQIGKAVRRDTFIDIVDKIGNQKTRQSNSQTKNLIYCRSVFKAISYAKQFGDKCKDLNDETLNQLSKDISNQIHRDYFLVELIRKGIAYHVGYIPSNLRQRIEEQFVNGKIRFLFCTSTLIEGVNLPADNLFITSNRNGGDRFDKVSFQNLMGRVGRIDFNLFGNVFLVIPEDEKNKLEATYLGLLKEKIPEQKLFFEKYSEAEVSAIDEAISKGDYSFSNMKLGTEKLDEIRKVSLVLLDDTKKGGGSPVVDKFLKKADESVKEKIYSKAQGMPDIKTLDLTEDQLQSLVFAINFEDFRYPSIIDAENVYSFLSLAKDILLWKIYEADDLGRGDSIKHFSFMASEWMNGKGLNQVISSSIRYISHKGEFYDRRQHKIVPFFQNDLMQKNVIIADTLYELENVIRFKLSNYFREISEKLKELCPECLEGNDWYEFIEYGTKDRLIIALEKIGFTRETATYLKDKRTLFLDEKHPNALTSFSLINSLIETDENNDLKTESKKIKANLPELFV